MKRDLEASLDGYSQQILQLRERVLIELPTSQEMSPDEAYAIIDDLKRHVSAIHARRKALQSGLEIFGIEAPDHKELRDTGKDLELAEQIWTLAHDWSGMFNSWKIGRFDELEILERILVRRLAHVLGDDAHRAWGEREALQNDGLEELLE